MKRYKIIIGNRTSILTYLYNGELLMSEIVSTRNYYYVRSPLKIAKRNIRDMISERRYVAKQHKTNFKSYPYYSFELSGLVHTSSGQILHAHKNKKTNILDSEKRPANDRHHVGVEIEFISHYDRTSIKKDLLDANLHKYCNLTSDGSIDTSNDDNSDNCDGSCRDECECNYCDESACSLVDCNCDNENGDCDGHSCNGEHEYDCNCECNCSDSHGHELRVCAKQSEIASVIKRVCKVLQNNEARVNNTCGLHIHLDMRTRDVNKAYVNLVKTQKLLYSMVPRSRTTGTYSRPNKSEVIHLENERFLGINAQAYSRHKTLEIRLHSGTVNAEKINHFIRLLVKIVSVPLVKRSPKTLAGIKTRFKLSNPQMKYITKRVKKFSSEHGKNCFDSKFINSHVA